MSCREYQASLSDYVDGTLQASDDPLDGTRLDAVEAHLAGCAACRAIVEDLHTIRGVARTMEPHVPPPHVWTQITAAIEHRGHRRRWGVFGWQPLAAAAALVVVLAGASWFGWQQVLPQVPTVAVTGQAPAAEPDPELVADVETQLKLAEEHYTKAIAGLEAIARADNSELDQDTSDVLQANLTVIDTAIGESRAALQTDPGSQLAQQSLFEALRSKVTLLQDTIALINEMRKGNQEGAARIVSGLNQ